MTRLTIVALSTPKTISAAALDILENAERLYVQTAQTPCILPIKERGLCFTSMDGLYDAAEDFTSLNLSIADKLIGAARQADIVYAVPGSGMDEALTELLKRARDEGIDAHRLTGAGYALGAAANLPLSGPYTVSPATRLQEGLDTRMAFFVEEVDTALRAGEVKLLLMEYYPDEQPVYLCNLQEDGAYNYTKIPLYELDRQRAYHAGTVIAIPPLDSAAQERYGYRDLIELMRTLRANCPWDKKQTHESLKKALIEECYEVLDAIDKGDDEALAEELGDVLLQCVFHAQIASEQGRFTHTDITTAIVSKLIYRHPHIFRRDSALNADDVAQKWEELKKKEKRMETQADVLKSVPRNLPALMRAQKVQNKAADVGFDWDNADDALDKLDEEVRELRECMRHEARRYEEMGDTLFAAVNVCRLLGHEPEEVLSRATDKFLSRFERMERLAISKGQNLKKMTLNEQNALWNIVKNAVNGQI